MKPLFLPLRDRCVELGFRAARDSLTWTLDSDFEVEVTFQTSKFGLPKGQFYVDAAIGVSWRPLRALLDQVSDAPVKTPAYATFKLLSMIVGPAAHYEWILPSPMTEEALIQALMAEGMAWARGAADPELIVEELGPIARGGSGLPVLWPLAVMLTRGDEAARVPAEQIMQILRERFDSEENRQEIARVARVLDIIQGH